MTVQASAASEVESLLVRSLLEMFNERKDDVRRVVMDQLWHDGGFFIDPEGVHRGKSQINETVLHLFSQFTNFEFSVNGPVRAYHGVGCIPWAYGPADDPKRITGIDVGTIEDGKIKSVYTFVDPPS